MGLAIQAIVSVGGSLPSLQDEYYAVCGRGTGCSEGNIKLDVASERHEVRCCSAVKLNMNQFLFLSGIMDMRNTY